MCEENFLMNIVNVKFTLISVSIVTINTECKVFLFNIIDF